MRSLYIYMRSLGNTLKTFLLLGLPQGSLSHAPAD